jgi:hypothetical protein
MESHSGARRGESIRVGDEVVGFRVEARDGKVGRVSHVVFERDYMVVDTGPWIFGQRVVVPTSLADHIDGARKRLVLSVTKDEVKNGPEYKPTFDTGYLESVDRYYRDLLPDRFDRSGRRLIY